MKKVITALTVLLGFASAMPTALCAQDPYDDLYYSPSKAAKQKKEQEKKLKEAIEAQTYNYTTVPTADYPAADTYSAGSSKPLNVDVDAYNRRYASTTAAAADTAMQEEFAYTRRIERYHNPDVVTASGDTDLIEYYYNTPDRTDVNIYIVNQDPWAWNTPWSYYNPYYWGPRWSFGWGYNPWFDYGWGWGCGWHPHSAGDRRGDPLVVRAGILPARLTASLHLPAPAAGLQALPALRGRTVRLQA